MPSIREILGTNRADLAAKLDGYKGKVLNISGSSAIVRNTDLPTFKHSIIVTKRKKDGRTINETRFLGLTGSEVLTKTIKDKSGNDISQTQFDKK